jgi:hypothetical protein
VELIHDTPGKPFPGPLSSRAVVKRVEVEKREDRLFQLFSIDIHAPQPTSRIAAFLHSACRLEELKHGLNMANQAGVGENRSLFALSLAGTDTIG